MEVHSMRLDHGPVQTNNMSYPQRQPTSHRYVDFAVQYADTPRNELLLRPNHSQATLATADLYKPSRSPLSNTRCPFPVSPQLQAAPSNINQVQVSQRYPTQGPIVSSPAPPLLSSVYRDYRQNRISLLHPEYGPGRPREGGTQTIQAGVLCVDGGLRGGEQPLKKIRLQDKDGIQPLRIDTRPGTYVPQVEAISPTLPEPSAQEDQAFRTTKDELLQQISKVDREIAKVESQTGILKKKQAELEEIALKPTVKSEVEEDTQPKHQSLPQKIYAENRKKAQSAHGQLEPLGQKVEWPLYNQPSDTSVYHENKRKNVCFKLRLLDYFKKRHTEKHARNAELTDTYSKLMQEWLRKVDKIESSTKRKVKETKNREFFEKVFPELRKQREDKERFNRVGARVKSEADMEEIMDNLQEQAMEDKKMRSYAVIPPILYDPKQQKNRYQNNNGFIEDMEAVFKSRQFLNVWTPAEKDIFKDKYLLHPKNFGMIASYLDRKSVSDCVQYYYLSKKTENYKQLLRKNRRDRTRATRNNQPKVASNANASVIDILTTGVTTRLQREQQRTGQQPRNDPSSTGSSDLISNVSSTPPPSITSNATSPLVATGSTTVNSSGQAGSITTPTSSSCSSGSTNTPCISSTHLNIVNSSNTTSASGSTVVFSSSGGSTVTVTSTTSVISSICSSSTTSSVVTNSINLENNRQSDVQTDNNNASVDDDNKPKFSDFNSFEDYNRKKFFNEDGSEDGKDVSDGAGKKSAGSGNVVMDSVATVMAQSAKREKESPFDNASEQQNSTTTTTLTENKKKKERRKDKEAAAMETSDEEAAAFQEKAIQGNCAVCNAQLGPQLHSRPLQPSLASQYGLREDQVTPTSRVCNQCRCKSVRSRSTHCPLPSCPNSRGRVKRLRSFPYRLQELPPDVRDPILSEFRIPSGVTKCCSACFNRIQRRLGPVEEWPEDDVNKLKTALTELGANWQAVGEKLNKLAHTVRCFYAANKKRLNLESCLGDRKPALTDEEESGSSTSSCEEPIRERERHSSDTASAAESPPVMQGQNQNPTKKEDYDSSATETADEAQTPDHYQAATITPITNDCQSRQNASPMSVKDLVTNVIELSLKNNPSGPQPTPNMSISCMTPTISSILNTNTDLNEVTIVSEYNLNSIGGQQIPTQQQQQQIFAKLVSPMIGATITPVSGPIQPQPEPMPSGRDDLVVVQVPGEAETLDLSIKKPRELPPPKHIQQVQQQQQQMHHSEPYMYHQERKSPAFIRSQQAKLPSPQPANPKAGSITLGTPIVNQPRYDGLLRQIPEAKMGSITKGTPIHLPHNVQDKRMYEYYSKQGRLPLQQQQQQAQQQQQPGGPQQPPQQQQYPGQYRQPTAYIPEQQLSSRQIIMNDYITSQQMIARRPEKPQYYPGPGPQRTPPPSQQSQQRQGVIQRHTRPQYLHSGTDALSSLANVAVQQPSLPVPSAPHEGLGKTMADNIMEQPHRFQIIQQHQQQMRQQQRMEEHRRAYHQQQQQQQQQQQAQQARQQARSDSSITAATLIDAIITHQINQTAEGGRGGEVVTNQREPPRAGDLLFQGFHREQPGQDGNVNGERPSSVISVDLDSDGINKSLTVKELTDTVISHDFGARPGPYYHHQENVNEQWKRRLQQQQREQQQKEDNKRSATPQQQQQQQQQQDERQIIRIAQPQKYHVEPVSPPDNNHWSEQNYRRYQQQQQQQSHISPLDYVKNRIVEVMRTEDDNKDKQDAHAQDKDRSDSPGDMVIDEEKHENEQQNVGQQHQSVAQQHQSVAQQHQSVAQQHQNVAQQHQSIAQQHQGVGQHQSVAQQQQQQGAFAYAYVHKDTAIDNSRNNEPKPLLSAQYEPLSDED